MLMDRTEVRKVIRVVGANQQSTSSYSKEE
jgi:hypothetical protein